MADALDALMTRLGTGRVEFHRQYLADRAARPNDLTTAKVQMLTRRRRQAREAVGAVMEFLASPAVALARPDVLGVNPLVHLRDLWEALDDLLVEHRSEFFDLPRGQQSKASPRQARWRGRVVAAVEMMVRAGEDAEAAQNEVAKELDAAGYHTSRGAKSGRGDNTIRGRTVAAWCKRAREEGPDGPYRQARDEVLERAERWLPRRPGPPPAFWSESARLVLMGLITGNPEGPVYRLDVRFVPPDPEK